MEIGRNTKYTITGATLLAIISGVYVYSSEVHAIKFTVAANSARLQAIEKQGIARMISDKRTERRNIESYLRSNPNDERTLNDRDEVDDEIIALEFIQKCIDDPTKKNCQ